MDRLWPTRIPVPPAASVISDLNAFAVVGIDGSLWIWGADERNVARAATAGTRLLPLRVADVTDVRDVSLGENGACALDGSGTVRCWPTTTGAPASITTMVTDATATHATGGWSRGCIAGSELRCWGDIPGVGMASPTTPVSGFAGVRDVCFGSIGFVIDAFGDTYSSGRVTTIPSARACSSWGVITDSGSVWHQSGLGFRELRTL